MPQKEPDASVRRLRWRATRVPIHRQRCCSTELFLIKHRFQLEEVSRPASASNDATCSVVDVYDFRLTQNLRFVTTCNRSTRASRGSRSSETVLASSCTQAATSSNRSVASLHSAKWVTQRLVHPTNFIGQTLLLHNLYYKIVKSQ